VVAAYYKFFVPPEPDRPAYRSRRDELDDRAKIFDRVFLDELDTLMERYGARRDGATLERERQFACVRRIAALRARGTVMELDALFAMASHQEAECSIDAITTHAREVGAQCESSIKRAPTTATPRTRGRG
jgi:hypothetical protein